MTMTSDNFSFGMLLQTFRRRQHLTQQSLAESLGAHRRTLIRWEQGDYLPESKTMVLELARHLYLSDQETRQLLESSLTALSPHWLVSLPRNPYFTGRERILEVLHRQLSAGQAVALTQSLALRGLGGVGKTQIALEYAYRYALEYSAVFWIGAETEESIVSSLLRIAELLQLPEQENKDQQRIIAAVQHWLSLHDQWLLIWDNLENLALLDRFLPTIRRGAILITTRLQVLGTLARELDLLPMEHEEALLFLLRRAKMTMAEVSGEQVCLPDEHVSSAASELVTLLGRLPLALDQAGAYIEETQCGLPAYLQLFYTQRAALLKLRGEIIRDHPDSVSTTFTLSFSETAMRHPAARDLLQICAFLQPDAIPEELFLQGGKHLGPVLEAASRDPLEWNRVVGVACAYSLLARQPEAKTVSMHRLVQAVLLDSMTEAERELWGKCVIQALNAVFPEPVFVNWTRCERYVPHAQMGLQFVEQTGRSTPEARELFFKAGSYLLERGRYAEAERFLIQAFTLGEQQYEGNDMLIAATLDRLATLYWRQGKYQQAEPLFHRALAICEQQRGPTHDETGIYLNNLALLYYEQGNYENAEIVMQRAQLLAELHLGPTHPNLAQLCDNMARIFLAQGKYTQAEQLYRRALAIWESLPGPASPNMTFCLNNLGNLYLEQGKYALAEPLLQRALAMRQQSLGSDHPRTAFSLHNLAKLFLKQGKYEDAIKLSLQALHILEQRVGLNDSDLARVLENLGVLYQEQGKYEQAKPLLVRALTIQEQQLGLHHPNIAQTLQDLATLYQKQGDFLEALSLAERAFSICSQSLGDKHPKTLIARMFCAQLGQAQECLEENTSYSEQQADPQIIANEQVQASIDTANIVVRGVTEQIAYTRTVKMREVTFTCEICGQRATQWHYPSGQIKYCSDACRMIGAKQMQERRVIRQREKRRRERKAY